MTSIIRLNESINDYASRPVITALGEPVMSIHPETYQSKFAVGATINPQDILIDGSLGQSKPNPYDRAAFGTGAASIKSDAKGAYFAMNKVGFPVGTWFLDLTNSPSMLLVVKMRLNEVVAGAERLFSIGSSASPIVLFSLSAYLNGGKNQIASGQASGNFDINTDVHTIALYKEINGLQTTAKLYMDGKLLSTGSQTYTSNQGEVTGLGLNCRAYPNSADTAAHNTDIYALELYLGKSYSDKQIADYLLTF